MLLYQAGLTIVSLLFGVLERQLQKLQRVQNAAARLIFQESRYCHITPLLKSLHWLPVRFRIAFKILLITFKAVHGLAHRSELISFRESAGRHYLRSNNGLRLNYSPCKSLATLGDRSFHVAAPKLWNDPPSEIRNMTSVQASRKPSRLFYFQKRFNCTFLFIVIYILCLTFLAREFKF